MPEQTRCTMLRDPAGLEALRPMWSALWMRDPGATPFQSPEWLLAWWHQFGSSELRTVLLHRGGQLVGIVPCYIYRETGSLRRLLPLGISTSDYLDGVFAPDVTPDELAQVIAILQAEPGWDEFSFPQLRPGSRLGQAFAATECPNLQITAGESTSRIRAVPLTELPRKLRHNVMNCRNRAQRMGQLHFIQADESSWAAAFDALRGLHSSRWRETGETGVLADPHVIAWHREALPALLRGGTARLSMLCLNGEILGVLYSLLDPPGRTDPVQYGYLTGFSTGYAELSPGSLLLALALDQAAREGIHTFDMLRGDEPYKQLWHPEQTPNLSAFAKRSAAEAGLGSDTTGDESPH